MKNWVLSIDIGGTNSKYGWVNREGEIAYRNTLKTSDFNEPMAMVERLFSDEKIQENLPNALGVGVGVPNGNSYSGSIDNAPNLPWKGIVLLKEMIEAVFHLPTYVANDANAAAVGEKVFGNGKKYHNFVEITLGTGLGSGIIVDNKLLLGKNSLAGEFGHIRVIPNGRACNCGRKGCLERYASATGIVDTFHLIKENYPHSCLQNLSMVTTKEIFDAYLTNDVLATEVVRSTAEIIGSALADFACFSDPEAYIFFGGMIRNDTDFLERIKTEMEKNLLHIYKNSIDVISTGLPMNDVALLGASATIFLK